MYNHYVLHSVATSEEAPVTAQDMENRIQVSVKNNYPWIVVANDTTGDIEGYAYGSKFREVSAYRFSVLTSVYVKHGECGKGLGTILYKRLLELLRETDAHVAIAGIAVPNQASVRLHQKLGFVKVGHLKEVGWKLGRWVDREWWQLVL